jgi:hypothetical protein
MTLNEFLDTKETDIKEIIDGLKSTFNSHEFIEKFSQKFEKEYIHYLYEYAHDRDKGIFKIVHGIIAKHLSLKKDIYNIKKTDRDKVSNENIFGDEYPIQEWIKLSK